MPHYKVWAGVADTLEAPAELVRCETVFPAVLGQGVTLSLEWAAGEAEVVQRWRFEQRQRSA